MKRFLLVCAIFPLVLSAAITGQWRAKATVVTSSSPVPQTLGIYATLAQDASGNITGTAGTLGQPAPIQNVVVSGSTVTFTVAEGGGTTTFSLTDSGAPTLAGTVTLSSGQVLPVTFASVR